MNADKVAGIVGLVFISGVGLSAVLFAFDWLGGNEFNTDCGSRYNNHNETQVEKENQFADFETIEGEFGLPLSNMSQAVLLNEKDDPTENKAFFEQSITANREDPYGKEYQRYNYVVCDQGGVETIWVAKWKVNAIQGVSQCRGPKFKVAGRSDMMINWFPEHEDARMGLRGQQSPCWLDDLNVRDENLKTEVEVGLLDAISKHYMIAQGAGAQGNEEITNAMFNAKEWSKTRVRYAGEIIVDVKNCEYGLNNDSGTYRPQGRDDGRDELQAIANLFSEKLGVSPTFVIDVKFVKGTKIQRGGIHTQPATGQLDCGNPQ